MISKIVSGGQTGADRAALDWAIARGIAHGGWCPKGRKAEDGEIPAHYNLQEMDSPDYPPRTRQNVIDSDGTVIFIMYELTRGSKLTVDIARREKKPFIVLDFEASDPGAILREWFESHAIAVLNVAGPRASSEPAIVAFVHNVLSRSMDENS